MSWLKKLKPGDRCYFTVDAVSTALYPGTVERTTDEVIVLQGGRRYNTHDGWSLDRKSHLSRIDDQHAKMPLEQQELRALQDAVALKARTCEDVGILEQALSLLSRTNSAVTS
jgi:hypothetical protein